MQVNNHELEKRISAFKARARGAGVKLTPQRLEIFRAVASSLDHPSAEAIYQEVHRAMPTVSLDTVYRTLWLLRDLGLVQTLGPRQESVRFDANVDTHHHFVCTECGLVRDFESSALAEIEIPREVSGFGDVASTHIEVRGVCRACAEDSTESRGTNPSRVPAGTKRSKS